MYDPSLNRAMVAGQIGQGSKVPEIEKLEIILLMIESRKLAL